MNLSQKIEISKKEIDIWERHMLSFCSGRDSAFHLSLELIFALSQVSESNTIRIIDIACGYGGWSRLIQQSAKSQNLKVELLGMDNSEHRLNVYQDVLGDSCKTIQGDILSTLPDLVKTNNSFDVVLFGWSAHEIPKEKLEEIYSTVNLLLKPQGILLIADFVSELNAEMQSISTQLIKKRRNNLMVNPESMQQEKWLKELDSHNIHNHSKHHHHNHEHSNHHRHDYKLNEHFDLLVISKK